MAKTHFITVRVTEREKKELRTICKDYGFKTLSAYVRKQLYLGSVA